MTEAGARFLFRAMVPAVALLVISCGGAPDEDIASVAGPTLPAGVVVSDDFERDEQGLAVDQQAAEVRFEACMEDAEYPVAELSLDEYLARVQDSENRDFRLVDMLCHEAAGTGWSPGNRPDEVAALNEQAWATTQCMRDRGWEFPDPVEEEFGRFLRFDAQGGFAAAPSDEEGAAQYSQDLTECVDEHAIDWEAWLRENPRN